MFFGAFRKTIGLFLVAFGIGAVIAIFLPLWTWILAFSAAIIALGIAWLFC